MAQALLKEIVNGRDDIDTSITVLSAGLSAVDGSGASDEAIQVMEEWGINIRDHMARRLTWDMVGECDVVLTMTSAHKEMINAMASQYSHKVFTLKEMMPGGAHEDICDPFGGSLGQYRQCAIEIKDTLEKVIPEVLKKLNNGGTNDPKYLCIGSDHGGFELKGHIKAYLDEINVQYDDIGAFSEEPIDYPDVGVKIAKMIAEGQFKKGILICGTGIGMSIVANRFSNVRATLCHDVFSAKASREHNDSNILIMGGRVIGKGHALMITETWLDTMFAGGRHKIRINKIDDLTNK